MLVNIWSRLDCNSVRRLVSAFPNSTKWFFLPADKLENIFHGYICLKTCGQTWDSFLVLIARHLLVASTRWAWSTFSSHWPLFKPAPLIHLSYIKIKLKKLGIKPAATCGELSLLFTMQSDPPGFGILDLNFYYTSMRLCHCQMALLVPDVSLLHYLIIQK